MDKIIKKAKSQGFDSAIYRGKWKGYNVYEAYMITEEDEAATTGQPVFILEKNNEVVINNVQDTFDIMDSLDY